MSPFFSRSLWLMLAAYAAGMLFGASAHADYAATSIYDYRSTASSPSQNPYRYKTYLEACAAGLAAGFWVNGGQVLRGPATITSTTQCNGVLPTTGAVTFAGNLFSAQICAGPKHALAGEFAPGGLCLGAAPPVCPAAGTEAGSWVTNKTGMESVVVYGNAACAENSCAVYATGGCSGDAVLQSFRCYGSYNGQTCTMASATTPPAPGPAPEGAPSTCPTGKCLGTVNDIYTCLACGSPSTKPVVQDSTRTTNPDGTSTAVSKSTVINIDGSTTTTTTTTTYNSVGIATGTKTESSSGAPPMGSAVGGGSSGETTPFCTENPTSAMCVTSSWSGSCAAFACDGDAIQCAIAKEQHARNCALIDATNVHTVLADNLIAGTDPVLNPAAEGQRTTAAVSGLTDRARQLGTSCPADIQYSIGGQQVTLPISNLCGPMEWLGQLAVALTLLAGLRVALGT